MAGAAAAFLMDWEECKSEEVGRREDNVTVINARDDPSMDKNRETVMERNKD